MQDSKVRLSKFICFLPPAKAEEEEVEVEEEDEEEEEEEDEEEEKEEEEVEVEDEEEEEEEEEEIYFSPSYQSLWSLVLRETDSSKSYPLLSF